MASLRLTYTDTLTDNRLAAARARTGGPRRYTRTARTRYERNERYDKDRLGSHMPLDTDIHWEWRNPLNILPALILFLLAAAVIAMVLA
jgi:hypothetical protein